MHVSRSRCIEPKGQNIIVLSLRATGEGHVSSIVFRTGVVDENGQISINPPTRFITAAEVQPNPSYEKRLFERKLRELGVLSPDAQHLMDAAADLSLGVYAVRQLRLADRD